LSRPDAPDLICEVNPFLLERQNLHSQDLTKSLADYGYWLYRADIPLARPLDPDKALSRVTNLFCTKKPERITMLSHISQGLCESS